jgi:hypothetical protein
VTGHAAHHPRSRKETFDNPEWLFGLKLDGFRSIADGASLISAITIAGACRRLSVDPRK